MHSLKNLFFLLKIPHCIKNLSIFLPSVAAHSISDLNLFNALCFFINFSVLASIVYLFNNINDYKVDINNKNLKYTIDLRNIRSYIYWGSSVLSIQIIILWFWQPKIIILCLLYFSLSITYNYYLKQKKYLDIFTLSVFHLIRIYYGSIAFNVDLSLFFIIFCGSIFLMIGANKRIVEIYKKYENRPYNFNDQKNIEKLQIIFGFIAILVFLLYALDGNKNIYFENRYTIYLNLIIIILMVSNFINSQKKNHQDIIVFVFKNKINSILGILFFIIFLSNSIFL